VSTLEERVAALEAAQVRRGKWAEAYREDLIEAATKYANMKVFQTEVTDGGNIVYMHREAEEMAEFLLKKMGTIAVQLLREMAKEETK
jgi:hypothetical protein